MFQDLNGGVSPWSVSRWGEMLQSVVWKKTVPTPPAIQLPDPRMGTENSCSSQKGYNKSFNICPIVFTKYKYFIFVLNICPVFTVECLQN